MKKNNRILSFLLALVIVFSGLPIHSLASEAAPDAIVEESVDNSKVEETKPEGDLPPEIEGEKPEEVKANFNISKIAINYKSGGKDVNEVIYNGGELEELSKEFAVELKDFTFTEENVVITPKDKDVEVEVSVDEQVGEEGSKEYKVSYKLIAQAIEGEDAETVSGQFTLVFKQVVNMLADEEQEPNLNISQIKIRIDLGEGEKEETIYDRAKDGEFVNNFEKEYSADITSGFTIKNSDITVIPEDESLEVQVFVDPKPSGDKIQFDITFRMKKDGDYVGVWRSFTIMVLQKEDTPMLDIANNIITSLEKYYYNTFEDWSAMTMAAVGKEDDVDHEKIIPQDVRVLTEAKSSTDLERVTIALTALGYDMRYAVDLNGNRLNVIEEIGKYDVKGEVEGGSGDQQGGLGTLNGYIFALIAYDSGNYPDPTGKWKRAAIINYILKNQLSDGGWSLNNKAPSDVDITAMTIQALAPYKNRSDVKVAIDKGLNNLSSKQNSDGSFGGFGTYSNSNSTIQVVLALTTQGEDPTTYMMSSDGKSAMDGLMKFRRQDNTFGYTSAENTNDMSTEQAFRALVSYKQLIEKGKTNIYQTNTSPSIKMYKEDGPSIVIPTKLTVTRAPYKTEYYLNDPMSLNGLELKVTYSDGHSEYVTDRDVEVRLWDTNTTGYKIALVYYKGLSAELSYRVLEKKPVDPEKPQGDYAYISVVDPKGQTFQSKKVFTIVPGTDTAFSLLQKTGLNYKYNYHPSYKGVYVSSIEGLAEFDKGAQSGWMYRVNGSFPNYSASLYTLKSGDYVEWLYTRDLGKDVGGYVDGVENDDGTGNTVRYVTARAENGGRIAPSGKNAVSKNNPVTFNITPDKGYVIWDVLLGGASQGNVSSITVGSIPSDTTLVAQFKKESELTEAEKKELAKKASQNKFTDVVNHWASEAINYVVDKGYFNGTSDTTFEPDSKMTRGMFVTVLGRMDSSSNTQGSTKFADVQVNEYYAPYVAWAASNGIVNGTSNTTFAPNSPITREEMATMMDRYMEYKKISKAGEVNVVFSDEKQISDWAVKSVEKLVNSKLLTGHDDGRFAPKDNATRAEVATVIMKLDQMK